VLLDARGGRQEIEEGDREVVAAHSVEAVAASSQEGDGTLTSLDRLDMTIN
jgi:hypothetical protein